MHIFHKWIAVAVRTREQPVGTEMTRYTGEFVAGVATPKTDVLFRCSCGKIKSEDIHGYWTLEQITGAGKVQE